MTNQLRSSVGLIAGVALFAFQIHALYKSNQSADWPTAPGHVTTSTVKRVSLRRSSTVINYEYHVRGKKYSDNNVRFGGFNLGSKLLGKESSLEKYPSGMSVVVHYNPNKPSEAVLETGFPPSAYILMLIATAICAYSAVPLFAKDGAINSGADIAPAEAIPTA